MNDVSEGTFFFNIDTLRARTGYCSSLLEKGIQWTNNCQIEVTKAIFVVQSWLVVLTVILVNSLPSTA